MAKCTNYYAGSYVANGVPDDRLRKAALVIASALDNAYANGDLFNNDASEADMNAQADCLLFARNCLMSLVNEIDKAD